MERKTNEKVWTVIQGREEEPRNKMAFWYEPKMGDLRDTLFFQLSFVTKEYCPKYMHSCVCVCTRTSMCLAKLFTRFRNPPYNIPDNLASRCSSKSPI